MVTVLIVSKTQMKNGVCVGGIVEETCELIRLHGERGENLPFDVPYEIGDRWIMSVETAWNVRSAPHVEDKQTIPQRRINNVGTRGIIQFVQHNSFRMRIAQGALSNAFDGTLHFEGNKNYVDRSNIPSFSTQFWIADRDLYYREMFGKDYYCYGNRNVKFVGYQNTIERIPQGTLIRLSLANWWDGDGSGEERCYLQLSGWYL